jgi:hypothetical protein
MTNQHPITPPPELVGQWAKHILTPEEGSLALALDLDWFANQAARWGADQELEACCEWLTEQTCFHPESDLIKDLRAARRPKPPSLKEQALDALREAESTGCLYVNGRSDLIRKALETLP